MPRMSRNPPAYPNPLVRCLATRLPAEVLGEVFLYCLPPGTWGLLSAREAPWLLTKVCHLWREVALSTPSLWSRLPFLEACSVRGSSQLLKLHLENSKKTSLSLEFSLTSGQNHPDFLSFITPHLSRSQHLSITQDHEYASQKLYITHKDFPLLKSLKLAGSYSSRALQGQPATALLEGVEFPWAQLTRLVIQISSSAEAFALLKDCTSLEVCHFSPSQKPRTEEPLTLPVPMTVHPCLQTLTVEDSPFSAALLSCLVTPALSTLKFIRNDTRIRPCTGSQSIVLFIKNSSAKLTSLTLRNVKCPPQDLVHLSILIPMAVELDLQGLGEETLQLLAVKSNSPHGVLFPCLKRLVIKTRGASESVLSDIFYSRLYLAPNTNIIENTTPLQHAELYLPETVSRSSAPTYFGESYQDRPELRKLISQLRRVHSKAGKFRTNISERAAKVIHDVNQDSFPKQQELGYYEGTLPDQVFSPSLLPPLQECFFHKLDAAFAALEQYHITHAVEILKNGADTLIYKFSCLPETAFLRQSTYNFHTRATSLLERWQPILSEYEVKGRWICERDPDMDPMVGMSFRLVYRRITDV